MEMKGNSYVSKGTNNSPGFMTLLSSAACEWLLIFLMFVDASLSYFLSKLAHYCELPPPCILCARIEHVLGHEKAENYRNLLCTNHKAEISSLMSCQIHDTLADVHMMCEECFMSIAMQNKSNPESYKQLVGKLGLTFEGNASQGQFDSSSKPKRCSCCNKTWRSKSDMQGLMNLTPAGFGASKANIKPPLPRAPVRTHCSRRESMRNTRDNVVDPLTSRRTENKASAVDPLSHVGYTELRINSDSDSEFPFSDDDDASSIARDSIVDPKERVAVHGGSDLVRSQSEPIYGDIYNQDSDSGLSMRSFVGRHVRKRRSIKRMELKFGKPDWKAKQSVVPELISITDHTPMADSSQIPSDLSTERTKVDVSQSSNTSEALVEVSSEKYGNGDTGDTAAAKPEEHISELISTAAGADINNSGNPLTSNDKDLPDLGKLVLSNKVRDVSGISSTSSPRAYMGLQDALRRSDPSMFDTNSIGQRSGSVERNDPGYESLDGGSVSEREGESIVDKLRRQVEYDRKCMSSLCKELEEERSASTIAANQAMAMITRLQEEKSALHMEALQYLRMMEEQAEYDMDALEKANEIIAEKEREIQDLEIELDFYRMNHSDEPNQETNNLIEENMVVNDGVDTEKSVNAKKAPTDISADTTDGVNLHSPILDFEDEKMYITRRLKSLEMKLCQAKSNGDVANGEEGNLGKKSLDCEQDNNDHSNTEGKRESVHTGNVVNTIENEISKINERMEALENNKDFLEHAVSSLQIGNEGLQFIQEIARQLQELRKIECRIGQSVS